MRRPKIKARLTIAITSGFTHRWSSKVARILFFIPTFGSGGAEAFVVNVCEELVKRGWFCSILSIDGSPNIYDDRLRAAGVERQQLIQRHISNPGIRYLRAYRAFSRFLATSPGYTVIHFNIAQGEELPFIWIAKRAGVPVRILHSHNSLTSGTIKLAGHHLCKKLFPRVATDYLACSNEAGDWLCPSAGGTKKLYQIIRNGIDTEKYRFQSAGRARARSELGLGKEQPCYICIARFDAQKNHEFLLRAFKRMKSLNPRVVLLLVGAGPLENELRSLADALEIDDSLRWLGARRDVSDLLSAADCLVLSSRFEGLPFTLIEAQAAGLPCVVSDKVSRQASITDLVTFAPLEEEAFSGAAIAAIRPVDADRKKYTEEVQNAGFGLSSTVDKLEQYYCREPRK